MGCVSSTLMLSNEDEFSKIRGGSTTFRHHIVSLTSTTYGFLTLDPPIPSNATSPTSTHTPTPQPDEIINSWELMAGLDSTSFRSSAPPNPTPANSKKSNTTTQHVSAIISSRNSSSSVKYSLDEFKSICPPNGANKVVIYTTTLRGVRETYEACNAIRSALESLGILFCERDISMDRGFRNELTELLNGKKSNELVLPPRVFIKGKYIGGVEEITKIVEDGGMTDLLQGLPKLEKVGLVCDGCGGARFLPCFKCNGSCKMVKQESVINLKRNRIVVVRCSDCNENGLVTCPICS